ncbi:MAG TPA: alcohol dehydrogenase catalytic domain-containing protein, partial [Thermoanaerobaculia bacterium]|nr:alcohol dehydrogenase catalytic domain-containing protein [Thermoanaerobaculia bacterium]
MRAMRIHETGGPDVLRWEQVSRPEPAAGQVRVRVRAAGVNFIDIYHRSGLYPMPLPFIPGQEGAGEVDAVGEGIEEFREGDRVAWASITGSYAEYAIVPVASLVSLPDDVPFELAAAVMLQGMTAHYLAFSTFRLGEEHRCLIHAAAGGVGLLLIQMAKRQGAMVIGTVGSSEKAERILAAGADAAILYREEDPADGV